jgi:hypothetical protein
VWLFHAPEGVQQVVWDVVAMAALAAMERGRCVLYAARRRWLSATATTAPPNTQQQIGLPQLLDQQQQQSPQEIATEQAIQTAVIDLWGRIKSFAALGIPRKGWDEVGEQHPFLRIVNGRLCCHISTDAGQPAQTTDTDGED